TAVMSKCDRRMYPPNEPASSWREERILKAIAELWCRRQVRNMVSAWQAAGNTPQEAVHAPDTPAAVPEPPDPEDAPEVFPARPAHDPAAAPGIAPDARAGLLARFSRQAASVEQPAPPERSQPPK